MGMMVLGEAVEEATEADEMLESGKAFTVDPLMIRFLVRRCSLSIRRQ